MANNTSNGNNANNANASKLTPTAKDSSQQEEELEDLLYRLDQAHAQVGLPWQIIATISNTQVVLV